MRVPLNGGAYQARSLTAAAQRCINLIPEAMPQNEGEPSALSHYPTPGLVLKGFYGSAGWRGIYRATNGTVFGVTGTAVFIVNADYTVTSIGTIATTSGPVSMADNGTDLMLVDGSPAGYTVLLATNAFSAIVDDAFYGADRVDVIDGFFVFNRPGTNQFYLSDNIATTFDSLYIAAKASLDRLVSLTVTSRQVWLFGEFRTEIYTDSGASDFPLQAISGGIEHGCAATHSVMRSDGLVFWLSRGKDGQGIVLQGSGYEAKRISTHALEARFQAYTRLDDAVGWVYQLGGHTVYVLSFPTGGESWGFDLATGLWHQWMSGAGRHRGICHVAAFGANLVGDYETSNLYALDFGTFTDNGAPIQRIRAFPHLVAGGKRMFYTDFTADMQCGTAPAGLTPLLQLRWSDDRGATFGQPLFQSMGTNGATLTSMQFRRLGMARDRVFELSWDAPVATVLQGAWIETKGANT